MNRRLLALLALLLPALGVASADSPPSVLEAGFGRATLESPDLDPIESRAVVFRRAGQTVAVVSVDTFAVSPAIHERVGRGLDFDALLLAATGTRSQRPGILRAPLWRSAAGAHDGAVEEALATRIRRALDLAIADLAPATVGFKRTRVEGLSRNVATEGGAVDDTLGVLRVGAPDGTLRGTVLHFAAGRSLLDLQSRETNGDWPSVLSARVETEAGGVALFLNGGSADVAPVFPAERAKEDGGPHERARAYGEAVAAHAIDLLRSNAIVPAADLHVAGRHCLEPARTVAGALLGAEHGGLAEGSYPLHVERVTLGVLDLYGVPGVPSHRAAVAMGQGHTTWIVAGAQDHVGTFLDRDLYRRGDFAADTTWFGPDVAERLLAPAHDVSRPARGEPPSVVRLAAPNGTARDLGVAHGERLSYEIRDLLEAAEASFREELMAKGAGWALLPRVQETGLPPEELLAPALALAARRLQRHVPGDLLDEMEGIAEGADVPYDAILLENTFLTLAEQTDRAALLKMPARCTNVVALGEATSMGQVLHGSTLDWGMRDVLKDRALCLVVEPSEGHPFVSVTWPGMVGTLRAMGAQGIAITEESCAAPKDSGVDGTPVNLLMRQVVQRANGLDDAVRMLRETPGTCGYKVTVSDGVRLDARVVEVTARRSHVRRPVGGLLFGCDPDAGPECFDGPCDASIPRNDASSARRYPVVRRLLEGAGGRIRGPFVAQALATTEGGVLQEDTLLACLFEPTTLAFHVALGADVDPEAGEYAWRTHDLGALLSAEARARYAGPRRVDTVGEVDVRERKVPLGSTTLHDVVLESPAPSGHPAVDRIVGQLFRPKDAVGVVILMPPWKLDSLAGERLLALTFASKGIACFVMPLPGQVGRVAEGARVGEWTLSHDLARTRRSLLQGAADAARVSLWLETAQGFPPERQGVMGVSLGGHVAAIACGAYPERFGCGAFVLAGANVECAFLGENGTTDGVRRRLLARGVTIEEVRDLVADVDPGRYGRPERRDRVLLVAGREDPVIAPDCVRALAAAWGDARVEWYPGDHYGLLSHLGGVYRTLTEHFLRSFEGR